MFFKKKARISDDELERMAQQGKDALRSVVANLAADVDECMVIINKQNDVIREKDEIIRQKTEHIRHLESVMRSQEPLIDTATGLYNRSYFERHVRPGLSKNHGVLTLEYGAGGPPQEWLYVVGLILDFTSGTDMAAVLWDRQTIKIFVNIKAKDSLQIREQIIRLLDGKTSGAINLTFKSI